VPEDRWSSDSRSSRRDRPRLPREAPERRPSSAIEFWSQLGGVPLASPWTSDRAERWWRDHLPESAGRSAYDSSGELKAVLQHDP
jgi:hypothetical protein